MISNFRIFFIFKIFIVKFVFRNTTYFAFSYDFCCSFVNKLIFVSLKLIILIECSLKYSQNFFMQSLSLYTSYLFCMFVNEDIVDIEQPDLMEYVHLL